MQTYEYLIEKSNKLLMKLGWTNITVRSHLQKRFGRKSRHLLSEEELNAFVEELASMAKAQDVALVDDTETLDLEQF